MKQFLVGLGILGVLAIYSLGIRHEVPVIPKPSSLSSTAGSSPGSSTPSSNGSSNSNPAPGTTSGSTSNPSSTFKDGTYTGSVADAYYGNVQVKATVSGGKLTSVQFLQYPDTHSTSVAINQQAMPYLQQEAISVQSANVQIISGATFTSQAFQQSLGSALQQAQS